MRAAVLATASLSAGLVAAQGTQNAPVIKSNPSGATFEAQLPAQAFTAGSLDGNVRGSIVASTPADGVGVEFKVRFDNVPQEGGPFLYHIHVNDVPSNGNCTSTLAHLDPYKRGEDVPCDSSRPETCQVGDLSGKHGKPNSTSSGSFSADYVDRFLSTSPESNAFFGNRSFVFHFANKTRITCANFKQVESGGSASNTGAASSTASSPPNTPMGTGSVHGPSGSPVPFRGDATMSTLSLPLTMLSVAGVMMTTENNAAEGEARAGARGEWAGEAVVPDTVCPAYISSGVNAGQEVEVLERVKALVVPGEVRDAPCVLCLTGGLECWIQAGSTRAFLCAECADDDDDYDAPGLSAVIRVFRGWEGRLAAVEARVDAEAAAFRAELAAAAAKKKIKKNKKKKTTTKTPTTATPATPTKNRRGAAATTTATPITPTKTPQLFIYMRSEEISSENIRWLVFCQDDYSEVGEAAQIAAEPVGLV
ncbi:hypothetical protein L249_6940 [Ophiocordyceps polyrhachis-furcata BCC 54312]|uniref:superoxide dismutase n=1 Tax=Ophiocordyceps polyrhachis-furcata BCC 54312 TaxID=1330021 RepID=A0A367LLP9_9HYPO|nr:hypothetical protein L249_6940 [Ophiocordyceps polyrhachis-furcata BCC 54312]